jgi:hypothetical protein
MQDRLFRKTFRMTEAARGRRKYYVLEMLRGGSTESVLVLKTEILSPADS